MVQTVEIPDGIQEFFLGLMFLLVTAFVLIVIFYAILRIKMAHRRKRWSLAPHDMVILHVMPRGRTSPNISPFGLKLETYLRMAQVTYQVDFEEPFGPSGKTPWITLNGMELCDSQLCLEYLGRHFERNFSRDLSAEERAIGRAFQMMMEEHFYWAVCLWRFAYGSCGHWTSILKLPWCKYLELVFWMGFGMRRRSEGQGLGCLSPDTVTEVAQRDLTAISHFLANKLFLFGDEPCELDCAIFGMLVQPLWCMPGSPFQPLLYGELANLREYCLRMKERFWPDWDKCLNPQRSSDVTVSTV